MFLVNWKDSFVAEEIDSEIVRTSSTGLRATRLYYGDNRLTPRGNIPRHLSVCEGHGLKLNIHVWGTKVYSVGAAPGSCVVRHAGWWHT